MSSYVQLPSTRGFLCLHCGSLAVGTICGTAVWDGFKKNHTDDDGAPDCQMEWVLLQCSECYSVSVQARADYGDGFDEDEPVTVYPAPRRLSPSVPASLMREFEEARACFSARAYEATVVMVRRILEGACKENGVQDRSLVGSIRRLKADGLIDETIAEWADALRVLGNEGAHYTGQQVAASDAEDALAFAEALLDHIYVLRKRFEEFARRRAQRRGPNQTAKS